MSFFKPDKLAELFGKRNDTRSIFDILNDRLPNEGFSVDKDVKGEIIEVTLAPSESKIVPHGLRVIPQYRLILRQVGNGLITDVNANWTKKTIGLKNNSATETVILKIKLMPR